MPRFHITYVRTSYMDIEVEAEGCREAEARFEALAATIPAICDGGTPLTAPQYRIVDVTPLKSEEAGEQGSCAAEFPTKEVSMMKQPLSWNRWMQSAATTLSQAFDRVSTTLEKWRERRELEHEFVQLRAQGEFERTLADSGISSSDLPRLMRAHPGTTRQLEQIMSRLGLDRRQLVMTPAVAEELREMEWRCGECQSWRECRAWLGSDLSSEGPRSCANAGAIDRLRDQQAPGLASGPNNARSGVLTELKSGARAALR